MRILPICGKICERLLYNDMFNFFIRNYLISANLSGFNTANFCFNQLVSINLEIYASFDEGYEVRGVFLDMSKAFDKVWNEGLIFKLKLNAISGKLLRLIKYYLSDRKQRVVLNGKCCSWMGVQAGVPLGSILGPLVFYLC